MDQHQHKEIDCLINIALVDDHVLLRNGLARLVSGIGCNVLFEADNGEDFINKLAKLQTPDLVLMDINMPVMDGFQTMAWISEHQPEIKVLALSMIDDEDAVIRMLRNGARGYLLKESSAAELKAAMDAVVHHGFYYSEMVTGKLIHSLSHESSAQSFTLPHHLTEKERDFLKLICSELTYKEIADKMKISPRTVDTYRDHLFEKLDLKTRTGLVIYAIKHGIVKI